MAIAYNFVVQFWKQCKVHNYMLRWIYILNFMKIQLIFFKCHKSYCKATILTLGKKLNHFGIIVFVSIKHVNFEKPNFNSNWDIKWWNKTNLDQYLHLTQGMLVLEF